MAYTSTAFFVDPDTGSDAPRVIPAVFSGFSNPSGEDVVASFAGAHGLLAGALVEIEYPLDPLHDINGRWRIVDVTATTFRLAEAVSSALYPFPAGTPNVTSVGGGVWGDAFATLAKAASEADLRDVIRVAQSPLTSSVLATWTNGQIADAKAVTYADGFDVTAAGLGAVVGDLVRVTLTDGASFVLPGVWRVRAVAGSVYTLEEPVTAADPGASAVAGAVPAGVWIRKITPRVVQCAADLVVPVARAFTPKTGFPDAISIDAGGAGGGYSIGNLITVDDGAGDLILEITNVGGGGEVLDFIVQTPSRLGGYSVGTGILTSGGDGFGFFVEISSVRSWGVAVDDGEAPSRLGHGISAFTVDDDASLLGEIVVGTSSPLASAMSGNDRLQAWVRASSASTGGVFALELTNAAGWEVYDRFVLPDLPAANVWTLIDLPRVGGGEIGLNLGLPATIGAVSLVALPGAEGITIEFDSMVVADTLKINMRSLISQSSDWSAPGLQFAVEAIDRRLVLLSGPAGQEGDAAGRAHGYAGPTVVDAPTYGFRMFGAPGAELTLDIPEKATPTYPLTIEGGWDPVTDLRDGMTMFDGGCAVAHGLEARGWGFVASRIAVARCAKGLRVEAASPLRAFGTLESVRFVACGVGVDFGAWASSLIEDLLGVFSCETGILFTGGHEHEVAVSGTIAQCETGVEFGAVSEMNILSGAVISTCAVGARIAGRENTIRDTLFSSNDRAIEMTEGGNNYLNTVSFGGNTRDVWPWELHPWARTRLRSANHAGSGEARLFEYGGTIESSPSLRPGGVGRTWALTFPRLTVLPNNYRRPDSSPLDLRVARFVVAAPGTIRVSAWCRFPVGGARGVIRIPAQPALGVLTDVEKVIDGTVTAWQLVEQDVVVTNPGVLEVFVRGWRTASVGPVGRLEIDNLSVSAL